MWTQETFLIHNGSISRTKNRECFYVFSFSTIRHTCVHDSQEIKGIRTHLYSFVTTNILFLKRRYSSSELEEQQCIYVSSLIFNITWRGGIIGMVLDLWFTGRGFESRLGTRFWCVLVGLCTQDYKSLCAAVITFVATLVNIHTHRQHLTTLCEQLS